MFDSELIQNWHRCFGTSLVPVRQVIEASFLDEKLFGALSKTVPKYAENQHPTVLSRFLISNENFFQPDGLNARCRFTRQGHRWSLLKEEVEPADAA